MFSMKSPANNPTPLEPVARPVLKVIGLGGGGCNAVERMMELGLQGIDFIAANTDHQALLRNPAPVKIQLGPHVTRGLGAGGDPNIGRLAAEESRSEIAAALSGADMVFLTAGMGGGTGTGSISVAAEIARSLKAVTIGIVTTPFSFEMGRRQRNARDGMALLAQKTNTLISIPNDRLLYVSEKKLTLEVAFRLADDVLRQAVQGITELITEPGLINVDFAHIRRLMLLGGGALMSIGYGRGPEKARQALDQALHHPLLDSVSLDRAAGVIANFTGGLDLTLGDVTDALTYLQSQTGSQTETVLGVISDERMDDKVQVILMITGLGAPTLEETLQSYKRISAPAAPAKEPAAPAPASEPLPQTVERPAETPRRSLNSIVGGGRAPAQPTPLRADASEPAMGAFSAAESLPGMTASLSPEIGAGRRSPEPFMSSQNLDLPAFLRRRPRLAN